MSSHDSQIQTNTVETNVLRIDLEISIKELAPNDDGSHSITPGAILQDTTTTSKALNDNGKTTAVYETERRRQIFDRERINLELHQLILLDKNVNDADGQDETLSILKELRTIVSYTKFINNVEEALEFIEQTKDTTTFLVCSGSLGQIIAPQTPVLKNIRSIYIYCHKKQYHEQWSQGYIKVKQVYTDLQLLVNDLNNDIAQYLQQEKNGIFSEFGRDNYTTNIMTFSWWNYLISMLCHLTYPDSCRQTFLMTLRNYYHDRSHDLKVLDEFERTYTSETAIRWYTRNTFFFHLINRALRQKNIELIFLFGFFIKDMYIQLMHEHTNFKNNHIDNPTVKVYRGQIISLDEIQMFRDGTDFIVNSFFSTSFDHFLALFLVDSSSQRDDQLQNVLFEIELDIRLMSQPFGHISKLSYFPDENEVLFMIGTRFKVIECSHNDNTNVHLVKLKLIEDDSSLNKNDDFIGITPRVRLKNCINEILDHFYRVSLEDIDTIFIELDELFPSETGWLNAAKYHYIARIYLQYHVKHYPEYINITLSTLEQALTIYQSYLNDSELDCAVDIGRIYQHMAFVYQVYVEDDILANKQYDLGITACASSLPTTVNIYRRMDLYNTIVSSCESKANITNGEIQKREILLEGIRYKKLQLEEILSCSLSMQLEVILRCIHNLAELQNAVGLVTEATTNYEKVIQIYLLESESKFDLSATTYGTIAKMYSEQNKDYNSALHYKHKELEYRTKYKAVATHLGELGVSYVDFELGEAHRELADIYIQLSQYRLAHENSITSKQFYEKTDCYQKEDKITVIEEKIKDIERFLSEDYALRSLSTIN